MDNSNTGEHQNSSVVPLAPLSASGPPTQAEPHRPRLNASHGFRHAGPAQQRQPMPETSWSAKNVERSASLRSDSARSSASESSAKLKVESLLNPTAIGGDFTVEQTRGYPDMVEAQHQRERAGTIEQGYKVEHESRILQPVALPPLSTVVPAASYNHARSSARRSPVPDADGMIDATLHPFLIGAATGISSAEPARYRYADPAVPQRRDIRTSALQMHALNGRHGSTASANPYPPPQTYYNQYVPSPSRSIHSQASLPSHSPLSHQSLNSNNSSFDYGTFDVSSNQGSVHSSQQSYEMQSQGDLLDGSHDMPPSGRVKIVLETKTASKNADERRRRNATASKRFRSKRKKNEMEAKERIAKLEKDIEKLQKQESEFRERQTKLQRRLRDEREALEHYRRERDFMRSTMIANGLEHFLDNRPSSSRYKKRSRSSSEDDEYHLTPEVRPDIHGEASQTLPSRHRNKKRSVIVSPTTAAATAANTVNSEAIVSPLPTPSNETEFRKPALPHTTLGGNVYADFGYDNDKNRPPTPSLDNEKSYYSYAPTLYDNSVAVQPFTSRAPRLPTQDHREDDQ